MQFPAHSGSLHLSHNQHRDNYLTVRQAVEDEDHGYAKQDWVSEEQMQKAIETDECWTLQWYPTSSVGFVLLSAADLEVLLAAAGT